MTLNQDKLTRLAVVKSKMKELAEEEGVLKVAILEDLQKNNLDKVDHMLGKFTIMRRKSWTYTEALAKRIVNIKISQINEQEKGKATFTQSESLLFTAHKI